MLIRILRSVYFKHSFFIEVKDKKKVLLYFYHNDERTKRLLCKLCVIDKKVQMSFCQISSSQLALNFKLQVSFHFQGSKVKLTTKNKDLKEKTLKYFQVI